VYVEKMTLIVDQLAELIEFTQAYQSLGLKNPQWQNISMLINALPAGQVQIVNDTGGTLRLFADPMLEHVFINLLDNAVRHGEHVTTITVTAKETGSGLVLTWEDNGIGVPAEDKERIFERGFGKHTGLGLFLIREILSITGITIRETGIPGKGARFEILVPAGAYGFLMDS
jgi:signal transduction histidine kinase